MHESLPKLRQRLKIASGQISGLIAQMEAKESPIRVAQQLQAVEKAVAGIKSDYVLSQMEVLLGATAAKKGSPQKTFDNLKDIAKYLHR